MSYSPGINAQNIYPSVQIEKESYIRDNYQPPHGFIAFRKVEAYTDFQTRNERNWMNLPDYTTEILRNLGGIQLSFSQKELNSRKLRILQNTYIKVQVGHQVAWIHRSDRYVKMQNIFDFVDDEITCEAKRCFYDATVHRNVFKAKELRDVRNHVKKDMIDRMEKVYKETMDRKKSEKRNLSNFFICICKNTFEGIREIAKMIFVGFDYIVKSFSEKKT